MKMMLPDVIVHENQSVHYQHHWCLCLDLSGRITTPDRFPYHTGIKTVPPLDVNEDWSDSNPFVQIRSVEIGKEDCYSSETGEFEDDFSKATVCERNVGTASGLFQTSWPEHVKQCNVVHCVTGQNIPPARVYPGILWPRPIYTPVYILA